MIEFQSFVSTTRINNIINFQCLPDAYHFNKVYLLGKNVDTGSIIRAMKHFSVVHLFYSTRRYRLRAHNCQKRKKCFAIKFIG